RLVLLRPLPKLLRPQIDAFHLLVIRAHVGILRAGVAAEPRAEDSINLQDRPPEAVLPLQVRSLDPGRDRPKLDDDLLPPADLLVLPPEILTAPVHDKLRVTPDAGRMQAGLDEL